MNFVSTMGVTINVCCVRCGVWLGYEREKKRLIDYAGMPHRCDDAQLMSAKDRAKVYVWPRPKPKASPRQAALL